ncbi:MAG: M1 family aminopeptidase [Candidatus Heimdallarchaeota archaeon]
MNLERVVLNCTINPFENFLEAIVLLKFNDVNEKISLVLNPNLEWNKVLVKVKDTWKKITPKEGILPDDFLLEIGKLWELDLTEISSNSLQDKVVIKASYSGKILNSSWNLSYIKPDFVELASYGLWYPISPTLNKHAFELTLAGPFGWKWIANGNQISTFKRNNQTIYYWTNDLPQNDITVLGLPSENAYQKKDSIFWGPKKIVEKNSVFEDILLERKGAMDKWLGKPKTDQPFYYAFTPRTSGGQYARYQLIATIQELSIEEEMIPRVLQSMLHEISHFWWNKTSVTSYQNWLDEALAEYTSSQIVSEKYGGDEWLENRAERVLKVLEKAGNLPSIRNTPRSHKDAYTLFYYRGFLLFRELHLKLGTELLKELLKEFVTKINSLKEVTTSDFIAVLKNYTEKVDCDLVEIVNTWLDYAGEGKPK